MKIKLIYFVVLAIMASSCSKKTYDYSDKVATNYDSFYIVDTIKIINPVRIYSVKYGGQFIVSRETLKEYDNDIRFFYRSDVFFMGSDFYRDLPLKKFKKYKYPDYGGCDFAEYQSGVKGLIISEFKVPPQYFILCLINANYFYTKHSAFDSKIFVYPEKDKYISFYKIVFPSCK